MLWLVIVAATCGARWAISLQLAMAAGRNAGTPERLVTSSAGARDGAASRRHRDEDRCISISTFAEVLEEPAQLADPPVDAACGDGSPRAPVGMQRQPQAVVAEVVPSDPGGRRAGRINDTDVTGELLQRRANCVHGRRRPRHCELVE
jgi:hypothetical protein